MNKQVLSVLASSILAVNAYAANGLQSLDDNQLREASGQVLLSMGVTDGSTIGTEYSNMKYYKMGFQADIEANINIKTIQLGCGGVNGAGGCDIDMENLALTGVPTSVAADGTPQWNYSGTAGANERAASSAVLRNPFVEFAINNPQSAATREVVGVRLSAEGIKGYMTAGTYNDQPGDEQNQGGINTFSGFITTAPSPVVSRTQDNAKFGLTKDQIINSPVRLNVLGLIKHNVTAFTNVAGMAGSPGKIGDVTFDSWGINIPQKVVKFDFPSTIVTGNRMSQLNLKVDNVPVGTISTGALDGPLLLSLSERQGIPALGINLDESTFFMGVQGSRSFTVREANDPWLLTNDPGSNTGNANTRIALKASEKQDYNNKLLAAGLKTYESGCINGSGQADASACTQIVNLTANVAVNQDFKRMHNLPVATTITTGSLDGKSCSEAAPCYDFNQGFYLSLQKEALRWPGSNTQDIAQRGWWMSFAEPLYFGKLEPMTTIPMTDVLPQVATFINNFFSEQRTDSAGNPLFADSTSYSASSKLNTSVGDPVAMDFGNPCRIGGSGSTRVCNAADITSGKIEAIPKNVVGIGTQAGFGAIGGAPLYVPLGKLDVAGIPAVMEMSDLPLTNYQAVVPNCWGGLKFC